MNVAMTPEQLAAMQEASKTSASPSLTPEQIAYYEQRASQEGFTHEELVALDQFLNSAAFFWLRDWTADQTMSEHFFAAAKDGNKLAKVANWILDKIQADHGALATAGDKERAEEQEAQADKSLGLPPEPASS